MVTSIRHVGDIGIRSLRSVKDPDSILPSPHISCRSQNTSLLKYFNRDASGSDYKKSNPDASGNAALAAQNEFSLDNQNPSLLGLTP
jgi:hypothetical protein